MHWPLERTLQKPLPQEPTVTEPSDGGEAQPMHTFLTELDLEHHGACRHSIERYRSVGRSAADRDRALLSRDQPPRLTLMQSRSWEGHPWPAAHEGHSA